MINNILHDTCLKLPLLSFQEHEKRCWSVDFNLMDPKLLASGSDDAKGNSGILSKIEIQISNCYTLLLAIVNFFMSVFFPFSVKLWSTNLDNSVASIEAKANVCCVKFSPTSRYHLAFGCAGKIRIGFRVWMSGFSCLCCHFTVFGNKIDANL